MGDSAETKMGEREVVYNEWMDGMDGLENDFNVVHFGGKDVRLEVDFQVFLKKASEVVQEAVERVKTGLERIPAWDEEFTERENELRRGRTRAQIRDAVAGLIVEEGEALADEAERVIVAEAKELGVEDSDRVDILREAARFVCFVILEKSRDMHDPELGDRMWM